MHKNIYLFVLIACTICYSCKQSAQTTPVGQLVLYKAVEVKENNTTPTVDIQKYTLIENPGERRERDAEQILALKRRWPLIMQSPSKEGFDSILSGNFTFTGEGQLLNREAYIKDRTEPSEWKITHVKYDNLTLQFFGEKALLTYRNVVTNQNIHTKEEEIEYISWADVYVTENNQWKIGSAHTIDFKVEKK